MTLSRLFICLLFVSCYGPQQAAKDLDKAKVKFPNIAAEKCAEWYPVKPIQVVTDSSSYKEWVKSVDSVIIQTDTINDTIIKRDTLKKIIYQFKTLLKKMPPIHDTIKVLDIAKQTDLEGKLKASEVKLNDQYKLMNKVSLLALFLLIILLIITILKK